MTNSSPAAAELSISALTAGDARLQLSFRRSLDRANRTRKPALREELDALAGILDGLNGMGGPEASRALTPTLRHLLSRVL